MSVVLVIAVGLFLLRDNISKFINNAATQIAGEESNDGLNEYGFYFGKTYWCEELGVGVILHEDGWANEVDENGNVLATSPGKYSYSNGAATNTNNGNLHFSPDGKTGFLDSMEFKLKE